MGDSADGSQLDGGESEPSTPTSAAEGGTGGGEWGVAVRAVEMLRSAKLHASRAAALCDAVGERAEWCARAPARARRARGRGRGR